MRWRRRQAAPADATDPSHASLAALLPEQVRRDADLLHLMERLRICTHPELYLAQLDDGPRRELRAPDGSARLDEVVEHYLASGARRGLRVCALFNPDWYEARARLRGLDITDDVPVFFHWLTIGWRERIVPTPLFDEAHYRGRHPGVASAWSFVHYLNRGCYEPRWQPSPLGPHHSGVADEQAVRRQRPLLLTELMHRSEEFDLRRTSWLEEGQRSALERYRRLDSDRMQDLIAKAARLEPLVLHPVRAPDVACPPHRSRRLFLAELSERVRRALGGRAFDTVLLAPGRAGAADDVTCAVAAALGEDQTVLVVTTDDASAGNSDGEGHLLDLAPQLLPFNEAAQVDLVLDVVRGVGAHRIVTIGSQVGWRLFATYGRQLSDGASLGAHLFPPETDEEGRVSGPAVKEFQEVFAQLDWVLVGETLRSELVDRFLMSDAARERLIVVPDDGAGAAVLRAMDVPPRKVR